VSALQPGTLFAGRYHVTRLLAEGGMGAVYEVVHVETGRRRALKTLHPHIVRDPGVRARFQQEARVGALIDSESVVDVFDAGIEPATGTPFLVMEMLRGGDLAARLERGPIAAEDVVTFLRQAAGALDKAHRAGVIHRDLKPENLFLHEPDDAPPRVKILDFGIAKLVRDGTSASNQTAQVGTPLFMAPEQYTGHAAASPAIDTYALGMVAYALLVGEPYFAVEASRIDTLIGFGMAVVKGASEPASHRAWGRKQVRLPPGFDAWFARAVAVDPAQRFAKASELVRELAVVMGVGSPAASTGAHAASTAGALDRPSLLLPAEVTAQPLSTSAVPPQRASVLPWGIAGGVFVGLAVLLVVWRPWAQPAPTHRQRAEEPVITVAAQPPPAPSASAAAPSPEPSPPPSVAPEPLPTQVPSATSSARKPPPARKSPPAVKKPSPTDPAFSRYGRD